MADSHRHIAGRVERLLRDLEPSVLAHVTGSHDAGLTRLVSHLESGDDRPIHDVPIWTGPLETSHEDPDYTRCLSDGHRVLRDHADVVLYGRRQACESCLINRTWFDVTSTRQFLIDMTYDENAVRGCRTFSLTPTYELADPIVRDAGSGAALAKSINETRKDYVLFLDFDIVDRSSGIGNVAYLIGRMMLDESSVAYSVRPGRPIDVDRLPTLRDLHGKPVLMEGRRHSPSVVEASDVFVHTGVTVVKVSEAIPFCTPDAFKRGDVFKWDLARIDGCNRLVTSFTDLLGAVPRVTYCRL